MSGTKPRVKPLALRKQLLLAESEVNRVQFANDWHALTDEAREVTCHARSLWSAIASTAATGIAGIKAWRDLRASRSNHKGSWISNLVSGIQVGSAIWKSFRSRE